MLDALAAAEQLAADGLECEVIDLRTPGAAGHGHGVGVGAQDGALVVAAQAVLIGSYVNEVVARVVNEAFDDLDAPVVRQERHLAAGPDA
ncbi:MAG: transketolase C-terminal domain-containing protein [Chloroflexota bacterium]